MHSNWRGGKEGRARERRDDPVLGAEGILFRWRWVGMESYLEARARVRMRMGVAAPGEWLLGAGGSPVSGWVLAAERWYRMFLA